MDYGNERGSVLRSGQGIIVIDHLAGKYRERFKAMTDTEQQTVRQYYDVLKTETKLSQEERAQRAMQVFLLQREGKK